MNWNHRAVKRILKPRANMRQLFIPTFFYLLLILTDLIASTSHEPFSNGNQFRRVRVNSPVFLRYNNKITVKNYILSLKREGFEVFKYHENKDQRTYIGYVTFNYIPQNKYIELSWVWIEEAERGKQYATHALLTILGIFKAKKTFFPEASFLFLATATENRAMMKVAEKAGFEQTSEYWHPSFMANYIKKIE